MLESFQDASAPTGADYTTLKGREIHIEPCALSGKTMRLIKAKLVGTMRNELKAIMENAKSEAVLAIIANKLGELGQPISQKTLFACIRDPDYLALAIQVGCGVSRDESIEIVDESDITALSKRVIEAMDIPSLGNSESRTDQAEPAQNHEAPSQANESGSPATKIDTAS